MTMNDKPANNSPNANFIGVDGCLSPSFTHSQAKTGASVMINSGFNDWNQAGEIS